MSALEVEMSTYQRVLPTLLDKTGKHVLIKGAEVIGVFDTYEEALKAAYSRFGLDAFLVKRIAPSEQVAFFSRDLHVSACPA